MFAGKAPSPFLGLTGSAVSWKLQLAFGVICWYSWRCSTVFGLVKAVSPRSSRQKRQLAAQRAELADLYERNATLQTEVDDLKDGLAAIEARARSSSV